MNRTKNLKPSRMTRMTAIEQWPLTEEAIHRDASPSNLSKTVQRLYNVDKEDDEREQTFLERSESSIAANTLGHGTTPHKALRLLAAV